MKTVVLDNNILQDHGNQRCITKIKASNLLEKIESGDITLYVSDNLLQQRFAHLYEAKLQDEYNLLLDFIENYSRKENKAYLKLYTADVDSMKQAQILYEKRNYKIIKTEKRKNYKKIYREKTL